MKLHVVLGETEPMVLVEVMFRILRTNVAVRGGLDDSVDVLEDVVVKEVLLDEEAVIVAETDPVSDSVVVTEGVEVWGTVTVALVVVLRDVEALAEADAEMLRE